MKKLSIFLLSLITVLGLTSCKKDDKKEDTTKTDEATEEVSENTDASYHLVGGNFGWGKELQHGVNAFTKTSVEELKGVEATQAIATTIEGKTGVEAVYKIDKAVIGGKSAGWTDAKAGPNEDGTGRVEYDGNRAIKAIYVEWEKDEEGEWLSAFGESSWAPGKLQQVESLTPDTIFTPKYRETDGKNAAGETVDKDYLGEWNDNAIMIGEKEGEFTVVLVKYTNTAAAKGYTYALGAVCTKEIEPPKPIEVQLQDEYDALVANPETELKEWELTGKVVAVEETKENDVVSTKVIVELGSKNKVLVGIDGALIKKDADWVNPTDVLGIAEGQVVQFTGKQSLVEGGLSVGDGNAEIVFKGVHINLEKYAPLEVKGVPEGAKNVCIHYVDAATGSSVWPGVALTEKNGIWSTSNVPFSSQKIIISWDIEKEGKDEKHQTVDLTYDKHNFKWTVGAEITAEGDTKGKYEATVSKYYGESTTCTYDKEELLNKLKASAGDKLTEEYDIYVWCWGGSDAWSCTNKPWDAIYLGDVLSGEIELPINTTGLKFVMMQKDAEFSWETKLAEQEMTVAGTVLNFK